MKNSIPVILESEILESLKDKKEQEEKEEEQKNKFKEESKQNSKIAQDYIDLLNENELSKLFESLIKKHPEYKSVFIKGINSKGVMPVLRAYVNEVILAE